MFSIISLICAAIGYLLFFLTDLVTLPIILIAAGFVISLIDLIKLYNQEKLQFGDFIKEAFHTSWGSVIAFLAGVNFIWLIFLVI